MVAIAASTLVSDCCHAIIMIDGDENYQCTRCAKPCNSDGTLGEYYDRSKNRGRQEGLKDGKH